MLNILQKIDVICFGGGDWRYHNHGHIDMQLMRRFAKLGTTLYINSLVVQKPSLRRSTGGGKSLGQKVFRKAKSVFRGMEYTRAGFWVFSPVFLPVHHLKLLDKLNSSLILSQVNLATKKLKITNPLIWLTCPSAFDVAIKLKKQKMVYQRADKWEEFPNVDRNLVSSWDRQAKKEADLTVFVSNHLYQAENAQCRNPVYLDHGVDFELFARDFNSDELPADIRSIKRPIIGFFGGIDNHTLDLPFLEAVVQKLPEMSFVLIGNYSADISKIKQQPNVVFLGQKPYEQIPDYGRCFDVCIMPWRQNKWIQACNPVKLKEYLALGKPVVSTPFPELHKYNDLVYQADAPEGFASKIIKSMAEDNPKRIAERQKKVKDLTWNTKAEKILNLLYGHSGMN